MDSEICHVRVRHVIVYYERSMLIELDVTRDLIENLTLIYDTVILFQDPRLLLGLEIS